MVQAPALAVAEHGREGEEPLEAAGQQLLAGELGRGVEVKGLCGAIRPRQGRGEGADMRFVAGRHLERGRLHLVETLFGKVPAQGRLDPAARAQPLEAAGEAAGVPRGRGTIHLFT